jgi:vacuolar-type H+-ATPase subunit F/Vma7
MTSRVLVVTTPDLAVGYRLAGAATIAVASPEEVEARLPALLQEESGVIAVHAPYLSRVSPALRRRLDATNRPLVVALPAGTSTGQADQRREQLLQMLRLAVGYEITFNDEGTTP